MVPTQRQSTTDGGSDMELSSGSDGDRSEINIQTSNNLEGDQMQRGVDFIGFESSEESEDENKAGVSVFDFIPRSKDSGSNPTDSLPHGKKRTRSEASSDDEGPSMGPPPGCPWMGHRKYSKMSSVPMMLTQELKDFVEYISPTREEHQVRKYVYLIIQQTVKRLWKDVEVVVFGSYETRLYLPSSDMDIVLLRDQDFQKNDFYKLASYLRSNGVATDISVIAKARVPIIKFKESISGIAVDVSFNAVSGIDSAKAITNFNEVFTGGLGSYTTVIMIISFLQMHPQIQARKMNPEENLGVLLIEFFELYGQCFNYAQVGLSVREGGSYFEKPPPINGRMAYGRGGPELLLSCIDPNDPSNDTAKSSYQLRKIRELFVGAFASLTNAVQRRNRELFMDRDDHKKSGRSTHVRFDEHNRVAADSLEKSSGLHHSKEVSLIKDVFTIPKSVLLHRRHIEDVFYRGEFQKLFNDPPGIQGLDKMEEEERLLDQGGMDVEGIMETEERILFKGQGEKFAVEDMECAIFLEAKPIKQDKPNMSVRQILSEPLEQFKKLSTNDKYEVEKFIGLKHELMHRIARKMIDETEKKENRELSLSEREEIFKKARQSLNSRLEAADLKKGRFLEKIRSDRAQIIQAVSQYSRIPLSTTALTPVKTASTIHTRSNNERRGESMNDAMRDIEYVSSEDSDDEGEAGQYFDNLMKEGAKEYGHNDGDDEHSIEDTRSDHSSIDVAGHRNPANVNASADSIQLPQLVSVPKPAQHNNNSPRSEQLAKSKSKNFIIW
ncbi:hypothetical protein BX616_002379 [Lobosporangium transversale]|nr:hypothetical protein BX616_002379 [Lobosporangium transversale]